MRRLLLLLFLNLGLLHREIIKVEALRHQGEHTGSHALCVLNSEAGSEKSGLIQQGGHLLDGGILSILSLLELQVQDQGMVRIDLKSTLTPEVLVALLIVHGLSLHDTLHVCGPTVLGGDNNARAGGKTVGHLDVLQLITTNNLLPPLGERLELLLQELLLLLLTSSLLPNLQVLLGSICELDVIELSQVLHDILIHSLHEVDHLEALLQQLLKEGRPLDLFHALAGDVVDELLSVLHPLDVVLQAGELAIGLGGVETEKLGKTGPVGGILDDTHLDSAAILLPELAVESILDSDHLGFFLSFLVLFVTLLLKLGLLLLLIVSKLADHIKSLTNQLLLDCLEGSVLLKHLTRDVQRKGIGVNNTSQEGEILGDKLFELVRDEYTTHVQLDRSVLAVVVVHVVGGSGGGNEQKGLELNVTLGREVSVRDRIVSSGLLLGLDECLVETVVLGLGNLIAATQPDGLVAVQKLPVGHSLGHFLELGLVILFLFLVSLFFFRLFLGGLLTLLAIVVIVVFVILDRHLLGDGGGGVQVDREVDELAVPGDQLLDLGLFSVLGAVLLQVNVDLSTTANILARLVDGHCEVTVGLGLPNVLHIIVVLGDNFNVVSDKVDGVETNTELTDEVHVAAPLNLFQES
mmetsp:Transcript_11361/g.13447  ORF Transcript_11361/g.13447 Transcript_11361/m.13447 type:complete len:635 (+) Transcript_11361:368-2272(+)